MIVYDEVQGSDSWKALRLGVVTASQFSRLLSPVTLKPSKSARTYMHELIAERLIGEPQDGISDAFMNRGIEMEDDAVRFYEFEKDVDTEVVGFVTTDDGRVGASPDRLVGDDGGLEIKCPNATRHVGYLLGEDAYKHRAQCLGGMYVCERDHWDLLIFNPYMPPHVHRYERESEEYEEWAAAFEPALARFLEVYEGALEQLRSFDLEPAI